MPGKRIKKADKTGGSFGISLVIVALVAIAGGYFLGNYFIKMAISPDNAGLHSPSDIPVAAPEQKLAPIEPLPEVAEVIQQPEPASSGLLVKIQDDRFATSESAAAEVEPAANDGLLRVQVGAYTSRPEAMDLAQQLQTDGYQTYITSDKPYRVQVGAFADQASAKRLVDQLISDGYSQVIIK